MAKFITVSSDPDAWGTSYDGDGFDSVAESRKIRDAAEAAGVEVYDYYSKPRDRDEFDEIDWFEEWCSEGHTWSLFQWVDWFVAVAGGMSRSEATQAARLCEE